MLLNKLNMFDKIIQWYVLKLKTNLSNKDKQLIYSLSSYIYSLKKKLNIFILSFYSYLPNYFYSLSFYFTILFITHLCPLCHSYKL